MTIFLDIFTAMSCLIIYGKMIEPKYNRFLSKIIMYSGSMIMIGSYIVLRYIINVDVDGLAFLTMTIPSFILFFILSKYKDGRFVVTFCAIDTIIGSVSFVGSVVGWYCGISVIGGIIAVGGITVIYIYTLKWSEGYIRVLNSISTGWAHLGGLAIMMYVFFGLLLSYPSNINDRMEYVPAALLFCLIIWSVYYVVARSIKQRRVMYDRDKEQQLLEAQLELKEVYFKMAYEDGLTGLNNRAAFEEKVKNIKMGTEKYKTVYCISMDLNNLKKTNDT